MFLLLGSGFDFQQSLVLSEAVLQDQLKNLSPKRMTGLIGLKLAILIKVVNLSIPQKKKSNQVVLTRQDLLLKVHFY